MNNIEKVLQANIDIKIDLENHSYISNVKFFFTPSENWYSWSAETTSQYNRRIIYPSANNENIKIFKTLAGAKRNFIKNYLNN